MSHNIFTGEGAGRRGQTDSTLGSGDRARGLKSQTWQSVFFLLLLSSYLSL